MTAAWEKNSHCSSCGMPFPSGQDWPKICSRCENIAYRNPLPVAVCLVPVAAGLLLVRRSIQPGLGGLALPGGYINYGESWQTAAAREVCEETRLQLDPESIQPFWVASAPDSTLIVFGLAQPQKELPDFTPTPEASELVLTPSPITLVFSLHTAALQRYFKISSTRFMDFLP